jgi:ketol-acid reductoisomerase
MGQGAHAFVSVEEDFSGRGWQRLLGLAQATGLLRAGVLELDARREANLDLFIEQTLGALLGCAIMTAYKVGTRAGLPPESLVLEMYMSGEMETVWQGFRTEGFRRSASAHGPTALYGGMLRTMELLQSDMAERFQRIWEDIESGKFAAKFQRERRLGYPLLKGIQMLAGWFDPMTATERRLESAWKHADMQGKP